MSYTFGNDSKMRTKHIVWLKAFTFALFLPVTTGCKLSDSEERVLHKDLSPTAALADRLDKLRDRKAPKKKWEAEAIGGTGKVLTRAEFGKHLRNHDSLPPEEKAHWVKLYGRSTTTILYQFPALFKGVVFYGSDGKTLGAFLTAN